MIIDDMLEIQDDGDYRLCFGKHNDRLLSTVCVIDYDYVDWMIFHSDLPEEIREIVAEVMEMVENGELGKGISHGR